jgi:glycosyltransferase involved in cell wall biosynthesis
MVEREQIPNVHFLPSSAKEEDVWAFHQSIDAVAHFRNDGESFGLNIVESMLCGKPVITHRSHIWNAHLEYLEPAFSRVANKDNVDTYASFMKEFTLLKQQGKLKELGEKAREKSEEFLIENQIVRFEKLVDESIVH